MPIVRVRLDLAYDGTDFSGWAIQPGLRTVQGVLEEALTTVTRAGGLTLTVAGRTDAGVHARGQVAHVDLPTEAYAALPGRAAVSPEAALARRLAGVLPPDVVVHGVTRAAAGFDARFSALWRRYRYRVCDLPQARDPLRRADTVSLSRPLDLTAMNAASHSLLGLHDFAAFCRKRVGATTIRALSAFEWVRAADGTVEATVVADAFCHSMVRALVGCVVTVGEGRAAPEFAAEVLRAGVRDPRVRVMPAHGLSLEAVGYPPNADLAARAAAARHRRSIAL